MRNTDGFGTHVLALLLVGRCAGLDDAEACPVQVTGTNYIASHQNYSYSTHLPQLPEGTTISNYGAATMCGFNGTIVVGGPLSLSLGSQWYSYSVMIRQSLNVFLDWLNGKRGGVRIGGQRFAMRFVWVDDSSSSDQVGPATAHATRKTGADFAFGGYSSGLTTHAARQSFADGYLVRAAVGLAAALLLLHAALLPSPPEPARCPCRVLALAASPSRVADDVGGGRINLSVHAERSHLWASSTSVHL